MRSFLSVMARQTRLAGLVVGLALCAPAATQAQSMSPMRGQVTSFTDAFAVKVYPANPYNHRIQVEVKVYDAHFRPVPAIMSPANLTLAGNASRQVTVMVPFGNDAQRRIRICTESVPYAGQGKSNIKAQVCGKFIGQRF